jgi:hypothetical protein
MAAKFTCPYCGTRQEIDPDILVDEQECVHCGKLMVERAISEPPIRRRVPRDEENEWDDEPPYEEPPGVPGNAVAAGIIWVIFGCLSILVRVIQVIGILANVDPRAESSYTAGMVCGAASCGLLGSVFIPLGIQCIRGRTRDLLGTAIGSLLFGVLYTFIAFVILFRRAEYATIDAVIAFFLAITLYVAGSLALIARPEYQDYHTSRRRRRRRR